MTKKTADFATKRIYSNEFGECMDVVSWEVLKINHGQLLKVEFISKNSPHRQGVRIAIDSGKGSVEVNGQKAKGILLWWDNSPKEVFLNCTSPSGLISVYNIYDKGTGMRSLMYKSGMILEEQGNKIIYHCNDYGETDKFDKLVFSIEKLYIDK